MATKIRAMGGKGERTFLTRFELSDALLFLCLALLRSLAFAVGAALVAYCLHGDVIIRIVQWLFGRQLKVHE